MSSSDSTPTEALKSQVDTFSPHLKLLIAIAAKVATLHALAGRYTQKLSLQDVDLEGKDGEKEAQEELDTEQARVKNLMARTIQNSLRWLQIVCTHLEVDMGSLPDDPSLDTSLKEGLEKEREFDIAFELVLVSLGLAARDAKEQEVLTKKEGKEKTAPVLDYTALERSLTMRAVGVLGIEEGVVESAEKAIAQFLYFEMKEKEKEKEEKGISSKGEWDEATQAYKEENKNKNSALKWAATGAGFVLGGVAIGLTGGLAAPALAPLLAGTFGIAAFGGAGGAILIGTLLGLGGGGLAGYRTHRRMQGLDDVTFEPITEADVPTIPSLTATVVASGFLLDLADSVEPWRPTFSAAKVDAYALKADPKAFLEAGQALDKYIRNKVISLGGAELIKTTALAAVYAGVALPLTIYNGTTMVLDSDFTRCRDKAKKAGVLLAEILEKQVQGKRPAVLIGYGPGATIILNCLLTLHARELGSLVYSATLISLPDSPSPVTWSAARSVVAHELINCYSVHDWTLALNARLYTLSNKVGGLRAVEVEGVRDVDVSDLVKGHLELRGKVGQILQRVKEGKGSKDEAKGEEARAMEAKLRETEVKESEVKGTEVKA
ncbi:hypothetical protein BCR35DRAFT_336077 [Leucosporidium creatinivorum]|uniref:DUF726-domain-containing protein n=1 Tax=Leucosporidium creatinivorum TaxID=106004 RepID=A0A1Y2CS60_9BASI|nr:hypothetical protein BCR35DRAFT_336077 [Leucosporidium creatinivorum]